MSSFGASAHEKKFVSCVHNLIKENKSLIVNGKEVALRKEGITGVEVAAIGAAVILAATAAIGAYHWGADLAACREMVGGRVVLLREDGVVVGHAADYDWRGRIEIGQRHFAPSKNRAWARDGVVHVRCNGFLAGLLASELEKRQPATPADATPPDAPTAATPPPADATPPALKAEKPAAKPAPKAEKPAPAPKAEEVTQTSPPRPEPSPEVLARHQAEEAFIAAVLAAEALDAGLPDSFTELAAALMALSVARDEGAPAAAFAALNRARGVALAQVRAHGPSGNTEVDSAFRQLEAAAKAAKAARAA